MRYLKQRATCVYLDVPIDILVNRRNNDPGDRPILFNAKDINEEYQIALERRSHLLESNADVILQIDESTSVLDVCASVRRACVSNSFGKIFRFTTWGESHGPAIGVVIDGVPANFKLDLEFIQSELSRRRPGSSKLTTARKEKDQFELLSGFFDGRTTGAPLSFIIKNENKRGKDYEMWKNLYRPGHADYTYHKKYKNYDPYGGGRSSARETAGRVIAGAILKQYYLLWV